MRKFLSMIAATGLIGAGALIATPAQADVDGVQTGPAGGPIVETVTVEDAGGIPHKISIKWNYKYRDAANALRVSVSDLKIVRSDSAVIGHGQPEDAGEDIHFDVSSHGTVRWTQHKVYDGLDLDAAADNSVTLNPRNPLSDAGNTFVRIQVGTDGDGLGNTRWVIFTQPGGLNTKAAV
jgi:hypothetical protein